MSKKLIAILTLSLFTFNLNANAQTVADVDNPDASVPFMPADVLIDDIYNKWFTKASDAVIKKCEAEGKNLNAISCDLSANLVYGDANADKNTAGANWEDIRARTYTKALLEAYAKFAREMALTNSVEIVREFYQDNSPMPKSPKEEKSYFESLLDKSLAVIDGKLDQQLRELNVNPEQYKKAPKTQKKDMLRNAITEKSVARALAQTSGMIPLQTFTGEDDDGGFVVRVVLSKSPKRVAMIKDVLQNGASIPANPDKKSGAYDKIKKLDEATLYNQFGVRVAYDNEGYPNLVSFGQAEVKKNISRQSAIESARKFAETNARTYLTLLLNSNTNYKEIASQMIVESETKEAHLDVDGNTIEKIVKDNNSYQILDSKTKTTGQITGFAGLVNERVWAYKNPKTGAEMRGVILRWSPKTAKHIEAIKNPTAYEQNDNSNSNVKHENNTTQGIETDDYDF